MAQDDLGIKELGSDSDLGITPVNTPQLSRPEPLSSGMFKGGILDPNVSLLDKVKNTLLGTKTDTAGHELQGPDMQEIPGIGAATQKIQHTIDPTESPFYTGLRPLAAGVVKLIGGTLASGFDPRTAGIKAADAVPPKV